MSTSQIAGFTVANLVEVEAATRAMRSTLRAEDYGALGIFRLGAASGLMAAGLAAASPIYAARWSHASNLCLLKRVIISVGTDSTAFTAGAAIFKMFVARSFSVMDTGGGTILPTSNDVKLRATMGSAAGFADIRISSTATLTAGTRTKDGQSMGAVVAGIPNVAGNPILTPSALLEVKPGEHPLVLVQNEGIVIEATVPATGTWKFGVNIEWTEITAY